jgi:host factor-I protein
VDAADLAIEPQFLSQALAQGTRLRIGQMNKSEHEGVLREIGRYEINVQESSGIVTLLKKDISYLSTPAPLISAPAPAAPDSTAPGTSAEGVHVKPNIQQEFLDKAIRENHSVTIFLVTGQRIRATIEAYDNFTLLIREGEKQHLFYKHAVTTINR